ncbi:MAG: hypothetical protein C4541_10825 [Candidatus Auribacter fodinae]|uniref:Uncharacterized protein n=1 Tax=Candidatus Auribacter fodinae TaxID=2093366 RepID=A0A3A4R2N3_9BACT|nr:MAG: hypothetical protein C4541_10825 [Candidatus Auribacter fodinae]
MRLKRILLYYVIICVMGLLSCAALEADTVLDDQFNGTAIDPAWTIEYLGNIKSPYWQYSVSGGYITVTNIYPVTYSSNPQLDHSSVRLSQTFDGLSDFSFTSQLVWNQNASNAASDEFMFILPGIVQVGYRDVWITSQGNFEIYPVGSTSVITDHDFPFSGTANVEVTRVNGTVNVYWNGTLRKTFTNTDPLTELRLFFDFKAVTDGTINGFFGTQKVNYATITGTLINPPEPEPAVPEPLTILTLIVAIVSGIVVRRGKM